MQNLEIVLIRVLNFEIIEHLYIAEDETKSTVSDTWSTDVLASDSEGPDQNQLERLEEVTEEMVRQNLLGVAEVSYFTMLSASTYHCINCPQITLIHLCFFLEFKYFITS